MGLNLKGRAEDSQGSWALWIVHAVVRFFQFVLALTVCGLYGVDLRHARQYHVGADSRGVYAEVVAGFAAVTCLVYFVPFIKTWKLFAWDLILFILWIALFGIFGKLFIKEDPEGNGDITRMKHAVWIDLVNALLWLFTAICGGFMFWRNHSGRSLHTGRATV